MLESCCSAAAAAGGRSCIACASAMYSVVAAGRAYKLQACTVERYRAESHIAVGPNRSELDADGAAAGGVLRGRRP